MATREFPFQARSSGACLGSVSSAIVTNNAPQVCLQHVPFDSTNNTLDGLYTQWCEPVHCPTNNLMSVEVQTSGGPSICVVGVQGMFSGTTTVEVNEQTGQATMTAEGDDTRTMPLGVLASGGTLFDGARTVSLTCFETRGEPADENGRDSQGRQGVLE